MTTVMLPGWAALATAADIQRELRQTVWALGSTAGLAAVYLDLGQPERALALALLPHLNNEALHGAREPLRVYWSVYRVLAAGHDPRAAGLLAAAADDLRRGADSVEDAALRRSFLENVPAHGQILEELGIRNEERALNS